MTHLTQGRDFYREGREGRKGFQGFFQNLLAGTWI